MRFDQIQIGDLIQNDSGWWLLVLKVEIEEQCCAFTGLEFGNPNAGKAEIHKWRTFRNPDPDFPDLERYWRCFRAGKEIE